MILLIDDDLDFCTFFKKWAEFSSPVQTDYFLHFSVDLQAEILEKYCLILIDLNLSDQKGLTLGKEISEIYPHKRVIYISSLEGDAIFENNITILDKCFASGSLTPLILQKEISLLSTSEAA